MYQGRYATLLLMLALLLSACELLSVDRDENKNEEEKEKANPELVWQSGLISELDLPAPIIEDSSVYVVNGYDLAKLNLINGESRWATELEGITPDVYGDILVDDQSIYLRFEKLVKRYSKLDGSLQWEIAFEDSVDRFKLPLATSLISQSEEYIFVGTREKVLVIDKKQGTVSQSIIPDVPADKMSDQRLNVTLAGTGNDRVYVLTSYRDQDSKVKGTLAAYNYTTGSQLWRWDVPYELPGLPDISLPTLQMTEATGQLLVMSGPAVLAVDSETGEKSWEHWFYENRTDVNVGRLLVQHNNSIYVTADSRVIKIDVTGQKEKEWEFTVFGLAKHLFVVGNQVYFTAGTLPSDIAVYALDAESGDTMYSFSAPESGFLQGFTSSFDANGTFIVNMGVSRIYGYKQPE